MEFVGVPNVFGESGEPNELVEKFGMGAQSIAQAAVKALKRNQN